MITTMTFNKYIFLIIAIIIQLFPYAMNAQRHDEKSEGGEITGYVFDKKSSKPIEFATVMIHSDETKKALTGGVTNVSGQFRIENLPAGSYYVKISFIGFEAYQSNSILIGGKSKIDLGKIYLKSKEVEMQDVVVKADHAPISYQIDKKVINVSGNITALSGTAVDVLENVPSVTVDIDGNVSLRGSGNFTVLIDGRPTIMDANTALQQIPATSIENIEIITNPSAKYDPEGTAGIINVIHKKNSTNGVSGMAGLNAGLKDKYGVEILTDYKDGDAQLNFGMNYNKRTMSSDERGRNWTNDGTVFSYYNSDGNTFRKGEHVGIRGSAAWDFGDEKILTFGGKYSDRESFENSRSNYSEWTSAAPVRNSFISKNDGVRGGGEYQLTASYNHPFDRNGHELAIELDYELEDGNDVTTNTLINNAMIVEGKKASESGPGSELTSKIDYQLPFGEESKFEAGYQGELQLSNEVTSLESYNTLTTRYELNPLFSNDIKYFTNQYALYSIYSSMLGRFGYKIGVRGEYTGREVKIDARNQNFSLDQWDYFPTAHFSFDVGAGNQLMTSYTRRINRPHGWEFEPFLTWIDAYNVRIGNPSILPEYIDSYELGFQKVMGLALISLDSYYRVTNNKIDRIRSFYSDNVTLQSPQNIGRDYALGAESVLNFDPMEKWNMNLMGNVYDYRITGRLSGSDFSKSSFNWNVRCNNTVRLGAKTMIQVNAMYNSPTVSAQGTREGYFSSNVAVRQSLFDNLLTATLQVRDLFTPAINEAVNESFDFYNYRYSKRESPVVMLNLRFNINNYKSNERENGGDTMDEDNPQ